VKIVEYEEKERRLFYSFADIINSPILVDPNPSKDSNSNNGPAVDKADAIDQESTLSAM